MTALLKWIKDNYVFLAILFCAIALMGIAYQAGHDAADRVWKQTWAEHEKEDATRRLATATHLAAENQKARETEQQYIHAQAKVIKDAENEKATLARNADAAAATARRLRAEAASLATRATQLSANATDTTARQRSQSQQFAQTARVLSELLASCADRRRSVAQYADEIATVAAACENTHNTLIGDRP
jgi:ABC-type transporter Mla subunit MlaD